jgi:peptidoglycan/LPS O-acetylase OafA/YrhL
MRRSVQLEPAPPAIQQVDPAAGRLYLPELDILRFVAFTMVFLYHISNTATIPVGTIPHWRVAAEISLRYAVSLFFLLSAFLITLLLEAEIERNGRVHIKAFYIRRITRIWPLYFFILLICSLLGRLYPDWHLSSRLVLYFLFMAGNWWLLSHPLDGPLVSMWSISVEEQFYLLVPIVVGRFKQAGLAAMSIFAIAVSCGTLLWMGRTGYRFELGMRANSLVEVQFFAAGTLLALAVRRSPWRASAFQRILLLMVTIIVLPASVYFFDASVGTVRGHLHAPLAGYLLILAGCIALFLSFLGLQVRPSLRIFVFLGKISYGLYAYHLIVLDVLSRVWPDTTNTHPVRLMKHLLAFLTTVALAWLSYKYLEKPFLRLKKQFTFVPSRAL